MAKKASSKRQPWRSKSRKKARRPYDPYHVIDRDGCDRNWFSTQAVAKEQADMLNKDETLRAPYRVYKLVTLEEVAVIRAAVKVVTFRTGDETSDIQPWAMEKLVKAVEAIRG